MPIALFHFHHAGLYGALANIVAIPLTTFVIMPLEALALLLDLVGLGAPFWWLTGKALELLLGSRTSPPPRPGRGGAAAGDAERRLRAVRRRRAVAAACGGAAGGACGLVPVAAGALWALATPAPDLLVTGDGRHLALRTADGELCAAARAARATMSATC